MTTLESSSNEAAHGAAAPIPIWLNPDRWAISANADLSYGTRAEHGSQSKLTHVIVRPSFKTTLGTDVEEVQSFLSNRRERRRLKMTSPPRADPGRLWLQQTLHGQVLKIEGDTFQAQLYDLSKPSIVEHAEFEIKQVKPDQISLLRPGALFYWFIGYRDNPQTRTHVSDIWMRRGGRMAKKEFENELLRIKHIWSTLAKPKPDFAASG
jgi:hypothetical protein